MAILDELVLDVASIWDLCFGNSVTVLEVLQEMHELQLRHCVISIPQTEKEIGESSSSLRIPGEATDPGEPRLQPPSDEEVRQRFRIFDMKDVLHCLDEELRKDEEACATPPARADEPIGSDLEVESEADEEEQPPHTPLATATKRRSPLQAVETILKTLAWQVANSSSRNHYRPVWSTSSLVEMINSFRDFSRVPIFEWKADQSLIVFRRIFSATDFFKMLCRYFINTRPSTSVPRTADDKSVPKLIEELVQKISTASLDSSGWFERKQEIVSVREKTTVRSIIRLLAETGYSAIPLVNAEKEPVGLISTSDFRLMMLDLAKASRGCSAEADSCTAQQAAEAPADSASTSSERSSVNEDAVAWDAALTSPLNMPIISYLSRVKRAECLKTRYPIISTKASATIMQIVHKLIKTQIHRIFIVSDEQPNHLAGLFSRTDFGKVLASLIAVDILTAAARVQPDAAQQIGH